jgi:hypothetical protein
MWLIQIKRKRHCEEIPVKNNYVISEAIPGAQMTGPCAIGIASKIDRLFFKMNFFAMTLLFNITYQNKN